MSLQTTLYPDFVKNFFPTLVTEVVEYLNEKRNQTEQYLFRSLLTPEFSEDGRWASVTGKYQHVAADVVALDSELPLKSRGTLETAQGEIPKIGMKLYLTEKQMKEIDSMIAQNRSVDAIVQKIFDDLPTCIAGVQSRIEDIFLSELSTGIGLSTRNNGTGVRVNMNYKDENKFGVAALWDENPTTANALDDLQAVFDKAQDDENVITDMWADDTFLKAFYKNIQAKQQYAFNQGFVGSNIPVLDFDKAAQVVKTKWGVTLHRVYKRVKTELDGTKTNHNPWAAGVCAFTCDNKIGSLVWTDVAEVKRPVNGVDYQTAEEYILLSKYSTNDPLREFTSSQAMVLPVLNNVDRIYLLNSKEVAA
ncbi:MAG: major capsid protein [Bacteroidales bacterium]|nr:major capsid protein [Bacteroidales bacterium]